MQRTGQAQERANAACDTQSPWWSLVVKEPPKWCDEKEDHLPWIRALAEVRSRATREAWCHQHVQAIVVAIDQYAEAALGNRQFFLNKPHSIGGGRNDNIP
jgi:hypothetical protein